MLAANFWMHVLALTIIFQTPVHIFEGVLSLLLLYGDFLAISLNHYTLLTNDERAFVP
jgi:hypothetical protein